MANQLTDLSVEFVSLVDRAAVRNPTDPTEPQKFLLWKAESGTPESSNPTPEGGSLMADIDEVRAELAKAEQERDEAREAAQKADEARQELEAQVAKLETPAPEADEIDKADLPEAVRARLEKAEADAVAANERIEKAENLAKEEREIRVTREFVAKAETELAHVAGDAAEFGKVLKAAAESLPADVFEVLEKRLKAANEQVAKGLLFKEMGRGGEPVPTSAEGDLVAKAEELRKNDPSKSKFQAMQEAARANPEAQSAYLASHR